MTFEMIQYILSMGVTDINDVLMNGLGMALGILIFSLLLKSQRARKFLSM